MPREILGDPAGKLFSPGTRRGNLVFVSGQLGRDGSGKIVPGGAAPETRQCVENVKAVLAMAGATLDDVMMVNVYLTELSGDYGAMNLVYSEYFHDAPPARATVGVSQLAQGGKVEISAIAVI